MKAQAVAARTRCRQTFDTDVEASRRKDDWGAPNSYPRRGDQSSSPTRRHPVYDPHRRISKAAATRLGDARGTTHDITGLKARTFITSLQKKDLRLARSDREHSRRGRALNSAGVPPAALGVPTTLSPSPSTSTLSPKPGWEVASFVPDRIEIPDVPGNYIMHSPMAKPITTAGPVMPSSIAEPTPVAESAAEAPSSLAEPTPPPTEPVVRLDDVVTTPV
ncbi:hypothetical protein THAOC_27521, partial [Thalassiosira oceanica]